MSEVRESGRSMVRLKVRQEPSVSKSTKLAALARCGPFA